MRAARVPLLTLVVLAGAGLASMVLAGAAGAQTVPAALARPALITPRAAHALTLDLALAGDRLVAVGERGVVLLSDDDAATWRQALGVPTSVTLTAVRFVSAAEGWAAGHMGVILHTTDGGETWQRQLDGTRIPAIMREAAQALPDGPARTRALAAAAQLAADGPDKPFLDLMATPQEILAIGAYGLALRSRDGGRSWSVDADLEDEQGLHLYGLARQGDTVAVAGEQAFLAIARDGGAFRPVKLPITATLFGCLALDDGSLIAYGLGGVLTRMGADGQWIRLDSGLGGSITSALALPDGRVLIGTDAGELALGDASGSSFRAVRPGAPIPITHMAVVGGLLVLTGPGGPRRLPLATLDTAT